MLRVLLKLLVIAFVAALTLAQHDRGIMQNEASGRCLTVFPAVPGSPQAGDRVDSAPCTYSDEQNFVPRLVGLSPGLFFGERDAGLVEFLQNGEARLCLSRCVGQFSEPSSAANFSTGDEDVCLQPCSFDTIWIFRQHVNSVVLSTISTLFGPCLTDDLIENIFTRNNVSCSAFPSLGQRFRPRVAPKFEFVSVFNDDRSLCVGRTGATLLAEGYMVLSDCDSDDVYWTYNETSQHLKPLGNESLCVQPNGFVFSSAGLYLCSTETRAVLSPSFFNPLEPFDSGYVSGPPSLFQYFLNVPGGSAAEVGDILAWTLALYGLNDTNLLQPYQCRGPACGQFSACASGFSLASECVFCESSPEVDLMTVSFSVGTVQFPGGSLFSYGADAETPEACRSACLRLGRLCGAVAWRDTYEYFDFLSGGYTTAPRRCFFAASFTSAQNGTMPSSGPPLYFASRFISSGQGFSELDNCQSCRNSRYNFSGGCQGCPYGWDEASDCQACPNEDYDELTNCTSCIFASWDVSSGCDGTCVNENFVRASGDSSCAYCRNGFSEASLCTSCRNSWTGEDCDVCPPSMDPFTDCTEPLCVCGEETGSCDFGGGDVTQIWNLTEIPQPFLTNETNLTLSECAEGVTPKDIYRHLSCVGDSYEGFARAFDCSSAWMRSRPDSSDLSRSDSYLFDGLVAKAAAAANDGSLSIKTRRKAAQLAATWMAVIQQSRGLEFEYRYGLALRNAPALITTFPAPPVAVPLGSSKLLGGAAARQTRSEQAIDDYLSRFAPQTLLNSCKDWFRGFGKCECGAVWRDGACRDVPTLELANTYTLQLYCSVADGVIGTGASVEVIQRTARCVEREAWKYEDFETLVTLASTARSSARVSAAAARSAGDNTMVSTLRQVQFDLSSLMASLARNQSALEAMSGDAVAGIVSSDVVDLLGNLRDDLGIEIIGVQISDSVADVTSYMGQVSAEISSQMEANFQQTTQTLEGLGDLVISVGSALQEQLRTGFTTLAEGEQAKVLAELDVQEDKLSILQGSVGAQQIAILFDVDQVALEIERTFPLGEEIGDASEEFYKCKRDQELAALARKRAMAIFDIVVGCAEIALDGAMMVGTFGSGNVIKSAASAGVRAGLGQALPKLARSRAKAAVEGTLTNIGVDVVRNGVEQAQDNAYGPLKKDPEARRRDGLEAVAAVFGETAREEWQSWAETGGEPDIPGDEALDSAYNALKIASYAGVPFAGGAANIMKGANVLQNYGKMRDEINGRYEANLAKSRETLDLLGELVQQFSVFAQELMFEVGQLINLELPARSVIESRSGSFWRATQNNIIAFVKSTDMYVDFKKEARRRALLEAPWGEHRQLLDKLKRFDPAVDLNLEEDAGDAASDTRALLEGRAGVRGDVAAVEMRRALDSKKADCSLRDRARRGLAAFEAFFTGLDEVVFFCESLHGNTLTLLTTVREAIITTSRIAALKDLNATYADAIKKVDETSDLDAYGAEFQRVLQRSYQRTKPEITSPQPLVYSTTADQQDRFLWTVCNAARYRYLQAPEACDFTVSDVIDPISGGADLSGLAGRMQLIKQEMDALENAHNPPQFWVRLPVDSTLGIRSQISIGKTLSASDVFSFSFNEPVADMRGGDCGHNHELRAYVFVLETREAGAAGLHPAALETGWYSYKVELTAPLLKLDRFGNRHVFLPKANLTDIGLRSARILPAGEDDCGDPSFAVTTFVIRSDLHRVCVQLKSDDDFGASAITPWGTTFSLTLDDLAPLVADEDLDLELVMYAQLSGVGISTRCTATQFADRQVSSETGEGEAGGDVGVIIGATMGALVVVAAGAFAAKKLRARRALATSGKIVSALAVPEGSQGSGGAVASANPQFRGDGI